MRTEIREAKNPFVVFTFTFMGISINSKKLARYGGTT
jgi:hypothetical protein